MKAQTKEMQAQMTPDSSLQELKKGNLRFTGKNALMQLFLVVLIPEYPQN